MADQELKSGKPSRLWRIVLVVSLALNLAIAGLFVGSATSGRLKSGPPPNFEIGLGPIGRALAPEERRVIRRSLVQDRGLRELNMRGRMSEIVATLETDPFEAAKMEALMSEQITRTINLQETVQGALLNVITDMTPARRAEFGQALSEQMQRGKSDRDRPSGG